MDFQIITHEIVSDMTFNLITEIFDCFHEVVIKCVYFSDLSVSSKFMFPKMEVIRVTSCALLLVVELIIFHIAITFPLVFLKSLL